MVGTTNGTGKSCTFFSRIGKTWGRDRGCGFGIDRAGKMLQELRTKGILREEAKVGRLED